MAGITLAQAQAKLDTWMAADDAVASGQQYSIASGGGSRTLTRADAKLISDNIDRWDKKVQRLTRGGVGIRGCTPLD